MKKLLLMLTVCSFTLTSCNCNNKQSQNSEIMKVTKEQNEGITRAIEYYMEGGRRADGSITAKAFTENATMSWAEKGKLVSVPIQTLYDIVNNGTPAPASYEIKTCDAQEDIAIVHIESQFGDAKYYDMFSMVKDGSEWKIVSKIYHNR